MRPGAAALLLAAVATVACDRRDAAAPQHSVRDSAGITIAENTAPRWTDGEGWTLADEPHLEIGAEEAPGHDLYEVNGAVRLSDRRIAVANSGSSEVRIFSADGMLVTALGGPGEGPGEFRSVRRIFLLPGDSLLATDASLDRLTVFSSSGDLVRTAQLAAPPSGNVPSPVARLNDGSFIALPPFTFGSNSGSVSRVVQDTVPLLHYSRDGAYTGDLGRAPSTEYFVYIDPAAIFGGPRIWGRQTHIAALDSGFVIGLAGDYSFSVYDADGTLRRIVRAQRPAVAITDAHLAKLREPDPDAEPGSTDMFARVIDAIPAPSHFPAYARLMAESDGHVWLSDYVWPEDNTAPQVWQVFDPAGSWLGPVSMPPGFSPLGVGHDEILGIYRDDMDVEHLRAYALTRGAP